MAAFVDCVCVGAAYVVMLPGLPTASRNRNQPAGHPRHGVFGFVMLMKDSPYRIADLLDRRSRGKSHGDPCLGGKQVRPHLGEQSIKRNLVFAVPTSGWLSSWLCDSFRSIHPEHSNLYVFRARFSGVLAAFGFEIFMMSKDPEGRRWGDKADTIVLMVEVSGQARFSVTIRRAVSHSIKRIPVIDPTTSIIQSILHNCGVERTIGESHH